MDSHHPTECCRETDHGCDPFVVNIPCAARHNHNFRSALWTGHHLQMTLMCIPACCDIGVEVHHDTDQFIRVEGGEAMVRMGSCRENLDICHCLSAGDGVFVPCGTWHNILNAGNCPLMLSSIYAPPQHPKGTVHHTKADAECEEH